MTKKLNLIVPVCLFLALSCLILPTSSYAYSTYIAEGEMSLRLLDVQRQDMLTAMPSFDLIGYADVFEQDHSAIPPNTAQVSGSGSYDPFNQSAGILASTTGTANDGYVDSWSWTDGSIIIQNNEATALDFYFQLDWSAQVGATTQSLPGEYAFAEVYLQMDSIFNGMLLDEYFLYDTEIEGSLAGSAPVISDTLLFTLTVDAFGDDEVYFLADAQGAAEGIVQTAPPAVPEPSTFLLLALGSVSLFFVRKRINN